MSNITPLSERPFSDNSPSRLNLDDPTGVGERFLESFTKFIEAKKHEKVIETLEEDFPHLAQDNAFVQKVMERLGDDIIEEKRFVFLVLNPQLRK